MGSQNIYFLYSKFSKSCAQILPTIKQIAQPLNIEFICIDDQQTRSKVLKANIKTVPCLIIQYGGNNVKIFEGNHLTELIPTLMKLAVQQQQPAPTSMNEQFVSTAPPPVESGQTSILSGYPQQQQPIQTIVDPELVSRNQYQRSTNQAMNSRLQPLQVDGLPPPTQPLMSHQIANPAMMHDAQNMMSQHQQIQQQQMWNYHNQPMQQMQPPPMGYNNLPPHMQQMQMPHQQNQQLMMNQPNPYALPAPYTPPPPSFPLQPMQQQGFNAPPQDMMMPPMQQMAPPQQQFDPNGVGMPFQQPPMQMQEQPQGLLNIIDPSGGLTREQISGNTSMGGRVDVDRTTSARTAAEQMAREREETDKSNNMMRPPM